jgi:type IV pilus assembly protein PilV
MKRLSHLTRGAERGVALLEVLVSILLFSLGVLGLIGLQARAISFSVDAEDRNRAALFANEIATSMWMNRTVTVDPAAASAPGRATWNARVADVSQGGLPNGTVAIAAVAGVPNSADITITWRPPQRNAVAAENSQLVTRVTLPPTP